LKTTLAIVAFSLLALFAVTLLADAGSTVVHAAISPVQQLLGP
jgi:hypothetical protein